MPKYLYLEKEELMIRFWVSEISIQNVKIFAHEVMIKAYYKQICILQIRFCFIKFIYSFILKIILIFRKVYNVKKYNFWWLFLLLYHREYGQVHIIIVHEKSVVFFFGSFFRNISKTAETILIKKLGETMAFRSTKKTLISEDGKNYNFRDNNCFVKMFVS